MKYTDYAERVIDGVWDKDEELFTKWEAWFGEIDGECNNIIIELFIREVYEDKAIEHLIEKRKSLEADKSQVKLPL